MHTHTRDIKNYQWAMAANMKTNFTMKVSFCTYKSVSVQMQLWECSQNLCMPFLSVQTLIRLHGIIFFPHQGCNIYVTKYNTISLVLRPSCPAFVACSTKSGRRPGRTYHVMRAAADVTFSLLTSVLVLSPSLFFPWIQFVLSVQFVLRVRLLLDRSWLG